MTNDTFILTENCNELIVNIYIYYQNKKIEESKKEFPDEILIKSYSEKFKYYYSLYYDIDSFTTPESLQNLLCKLKLEAEIINKQPC